MQIIKVLYIQMLLTALALCLIWQSTLARHEGYRLELLRREIENAKVEAQKYSAQISKLRSPQRVERLVERLGLDIEQAPQPPEPAPDTDSDGPPDGDSLPDTTLATRPQ